MQSASVEKENAMSSERLVLLTSGNGVTLSRVTLPNTKAKSAVSTYVVESHRMPNAKAFGTRTDALDYYEEEIERCRLLDVT
jgi:hypothetical protein